MEPREDLMSRQESARAGLGAADHPEPHGLGRHHLRAGRDADPHEEIQMSEICKVSAERQGDIAILLTDGYINNQGGEEIAREAYAQLDSGARALLLNLEKTRIVNSIGISILIEVLERVMDRKGELAFCGLTPTIDKTFRIMGLAQYAKVFPTQEEAMSALATAGPGA